MSISDREKRKEQMNVKEAVRNIQASTKLEQGPVEHRLSLQLRTRNFEQMWKPSKWN